MFSFDLMWLILQLVFLTGKPKPAACCGFYSNERTTTVDKVEYLKDQLAVLCAEVAYYQKKALAVTDEDRKSTRLNSSH